MAGDAWFDDLMKQISSGAAATSEVATAKSHSEAVDKVLTQHPEYADEVKLGLIQLLKQENYYFVQSENPPPGPNEENDIGDHYAELIDVVSSLNDERTIPGLVGAITTGGMAQGLMKYGEKPLEPVLAQLKNPDALGRASAPGMTIALLEKGGDPGSHATIKEFPRPFLNDPRPVVRTHAVREIDCLSDRQEFVPMLEQIREDSRPPTSREGRRRGMEDSFILSGSMRDEYCATSRRGKLADREVRPS